MPRKTTGEPTTNDRVREAWGRQGDTYCHIVPAILEAADLSRHRVDFLREAVRLILSCAECDVVEVLLGEENGVSRWAMRNAPGGTATFDFSHRFPPGGTPGDPDGERKRKLLLDGAARRSGTGLRVSPRGTLYSGSGDVPESAPLPATRGIPSDAGASSPGRAASLAWISFPVGRVDRGLLCLEWSAPEILTPARIEFFEEIGRVLGIAVAGHRKLTSLSKRVKELTTLHGIARAEADPRDEDLAEVLERIVGLLPRAWSYPEVAEARLELDGTLHATPGFGDARAASHGVEIHVDGRRRGRIEVAYREPRPAADEGPFLDEERGLLQAVAAEVSRLVTTREAESERFLLQEQVRHADRLATIGQLSAGIAHEINEPLGGILGFAQLSRKHENLDPAVAEDLDKIVAAALHAREVVRKLMLFARQHVPARIGLNLNRIVETALSLVENQARQAGVDFESRLDPDLPDIQADAGQLQQVVVNLAVNALQAMPDGGTVIVETGASGSRVHLAVKDHGTGIAEENLERIFLPFFTTKDVGQGTGLGLAVVHGIVASHEGEIDVKSHPGRGSRFEVRLPLAPPGDAGRERP
jgi:two-component system NtrC family sensor kinase